MLKFIDSNGGPLLMLQRDLLPYWGGTDNIGGVANPHRNRMSFEGPSDYDRGCEIRGWIAPLQVNDRAGVVFLGDHLGLALVTESANVFFAVRPYYEIENLDEHVMSAAENQNCFTKEFETVVSCSQAIVFDSAFAGLEIIGGRLEIDVLPGIYEVLTYWQKTPDAEVVFHKFNLCRGR